MSRVLELTGKKFGRLTAIECIGSVKKKKVWACLCECGNTTKALATSLTRGNTRSCGCLQRDIATTHGQYQSPEYKIWNTMIHRCANPNAQHFERYGGRGITVCDAWMQFENFYNDMGARSSPKHTIERIDNDKGYSPDNCKWATRDEQYHNRGIYKTNNSGHPGIGWSKKNDKWRVRITVSKKEIHVGMYDRLEDAIEARRKAEQKYWNKSS